MAARRRLGACLLAVLAVVGAGCGVRPDEQPRTIDDPVPVVGAPASGDADAGGRERIYLVGPDASHLLRSVPREAASTQNLIEVLLRGPSDAELGAQLQTLIPAGTELLSSRRQGSTLYLDFSTTLTTWSAANQPQALAQIVYTAAEDDGVEAVQITVAGQVVPLPKGNGDATTEPLTVYDYPGFVLTAQPAYPSLPAA